MHMQTPIYVGAISQLFGKMLSQFKLAFPRRQVLHIYVEGAVKETFASSTLPQESIISW